LSFRYNFLDEVSALRLDCGAGGGGVSGLRFHATAVARAGTSPSAAAGAVNDFAKLLSESERAQLTAQLQRLCDEMGGVVVLVTLPRVAPLKPSEYAFWLYHHWQLPPTGLLLLLALKERHIESEVGLAWEPFLSDVETGGGRCKQPCRC
jgi:uncharacterized membrane protein YgcG